jgi:hypothetical protein
MLAVLVAEQVKGQQQMVAQETLVDTHQQKVFAEVTVPHQVVG